MDDIFHSFHYLIEITSKLDYWYRRDQKLHTKETGKIVKVWHTKLSHWMDENYHDAGFKKELDEFKIERRSNYGGRNKK